MIPGRTGDLVSLLPFGDGVEGVTTSGLRYPLLDEPLPAGPARFWLAPYNTGWHLAHHVDPGVPFRRLPQVHDELVAAGYVAGGLEWPSYLALWRALASR